MMSWNTSTYCCNWNGVTCNDSTGDVVGLDVSCGMLKGTIHPNTSIFNLPHLQRLNLDYNDFTGSQIPSEIGRLSNSLTHLDLSFCSFSGQVPPDITLLHKLVSLDLSLNMLLTMRPHVFNNLLQNFTNFEQLSLQYVNISSVLPDRLNISSSLKLLNVCDTGMQGKLPCYIFNLHSLETLYLSFNMFGGMVPFESFALPSLKELYLNNNNHLAGHIDMQTFRKLSNLTYLDLSHNNFSGEWELDKLLSSLTNLEELDLSYNNFSVTTKNANNYVNSGLKYLKLASCKLKVFPNSIRAMKQLRLLDLSSNEIHGQIPHWAGEIGVQLDSGTIPSINLQHEQAYMGNNSFQGTIPNVYGDCEYLQGLILNGNQLEGELPCSLSKCRSLSVIDLGNNHLNGTFPGWSEDLPNLQFLTYLTIGVDQDIPRLFGNLTIVDLSNNYFDGEIPNIIGNLSSLKVLNLSHNHLNSQIPYSLGNLSEIESLDLSWNQLTREIPESLAGIKGLEVLRLSHNRLVGRMTERSSKHFMRTHLKGMLDFVGIRCPKSAMSIHTNHSLRHAKIKRRKVDLRGKW
ncbi:leucine-rich repeat-containing protein [Tanacetum coccineum]